NDPTVIKRLLTDKGRWAVVGLSANRARTAHGIAGYVRDLGHEIVPVHPKAETVYDQQGYPDLASVPGDVDVVDVIVNSELAGGVVDDAIARGAKAVWLQQGVIDEAAAQRATDAGLDVVMDTCPAIEAPRLGLVWRPIPWCARVPGPPRHGCTQTTTNRAGRGHAVGSPLAGADQPRDRGWFAGSVTRVRGEAHHREYEHEVQDDHDGGDHERDHAQLLGGGAGRVGLGVAAGRPQRVDVDRPGHGDKGQGPEADDRRDGPADVGGRPGAGGGAVVIATRGLVTGRHRVAGLRRVVRLPRVPRLGAVSGLRRVVGLRAILRVRHASSFSGGAAVSPRRR